MWQLTIDGRCWHLTYQENYTKWLMVYHYISIDNTHHEQQNIWLNNFNIWLNNFLFLVVCLLLGETIYHYCKLNAGGTLCCSWSCELHRHAYGVVYFVQSLQASLWNELFVILVLPTYGFFGMLFRTMVSLQIFVGASKFRTRKYNMDAMNSRTKQTGRMAKHTNN
jgi:hypothetical protein